MRTTAGRRRSRGQALMEFALVAPVFLLLLFGLIETGRFILYYEVLSNATRDGARYAIVNGANSLTCPTGPAIPGGWDCDPTGADVADRVRESAFGVLGSGVSVQRCWWYDACDFSTHGDGDNGRSATVTVSASYTYSTLVPILPLPNITITAESSLVINN